MTMSERALEMAKEKQQTAWERAFKAANPGAKNFWLSENNRLAELIVKIGYRLEAIQLVAV